MPCSSKVTKVAILKAHHARNVADLAIEAAAMTEVATAARVAAATTDAGHAPIVTTMDGAMIEANAVHDDPRVAMMEARDARARRADVNRPLDRPR